MITILSQNYKDFSITNYNDLLKDLPYHRLSCSCGNKGNLIRYGTYFRKVKLPQGIEHLQVQRIRCNACGKTHAILPHWLVPYSSIILTDQISIISNHQSDVQSLAIMEVNPEIGESDIRYIIRQFILYWKERLRSAKISLNTSLTYHCFNHFNRQFMQIKRTPNLLFIKPT